MMTAAIFIPSLSGLWMLVCLRFVFIILVVWSFYCCAGKYLIVVCVNSDDVWFKQLRFIATLQIILAFQLAKLSGLYEHIIFCWALVFGYSECLCGSESIHMYVFIYRYISSQEQYCVLSCYWMKMWSVSCSGISWLFIGTLETVKTSTGDQTRKYHTIKWINY